MQQIMIRKADINDISRIAEILVFDKRITCRPIFKDDDYSFNTLQVLSVAREYSAPEKLDGIYVYDDGIVKGLVRTGGSEVIELYVDWFFQRQGIGEKLLEFAVREMGCSWLWAVEKNVNAIAFYHAHGFFENGEKKFEEDTTEYLVKMTLKTENER